MQLAQRVRLFDGHLGRELSAAAPGANLLAPRTAFNVAAAFQFDQVTAVAQHRPLFHQFPQRFLHVCLCALDSTEIAATAASAMTIPSACRTVICSLK